MNDMQRLREKIKNLNVLFVDDEKEIRDGTKNFLSKFFENVQVASNGEDAVEVFKKNRFDIVITDIMMPKMDGIEMCKEIRKIDSDIFIIFLTASRNLTEDDKTLGNIQLQKPLSFDDMIVIMKKLGEIQW